MSLFWVSLYWVAAAIFIFYFTSTAYLGYSAEAVASTGSLGELFSVGAGVAASSLGIYSSFCGFYSSSIGFYSSYNGFYSSSASVFSGSTFSISGLSSLFSDVENARIPYKL